MGGALALLGMLFWAAFIAEWGAWFWIPASILTIVSILMLIVYVVMTDGKEKDGDKTHQKTMQGLATGARLPYEWQPYDKNQFDHGHGHGDHDLSWSRRFGLGFRRWLGIRR